MRRFTLIVSACIIAMFHVARAQGRQPRLAAPARTASSAPTLPVRRVVLYKNGVGYFEHLGRVRGTQSIAIDFNTAQLNDVLKSLTLLDLGGGRIADVSFNSQAPFAQRLDALTLPVGERATMSELLGALRGARLEVRSGERSIAGRLLSVERQPRKDEGPRDVLTLVSDAGDMRSVEIGPAVSVRLAERESASQVSAYLGLLASNRSQDHRRMTIAAVGEGTRDLLVSYISEVPVWKTNYRLVLPRGGGTPVLQGWAIVDNTIGEDWNGVELSLVAGAPQSFTQPVSQPLYTRRPAIAVSRAMSQTPQVHQETLTERTGGLTGRVFDNAGSVLPGVTVTAIERSGRRATVVTDTQGRYTLSLADGMYRLEFELIGFRRVVLEGVQFDGTGRPVQDVALQVGALAETVTVTAQTPLTNRALGSSGVGGGVGVGPGSGGGTGGGSYRPSSPAAAPAPAPPPAPVIDRAMVESRLADLQASAQGQSLGDLFEYRVEGPITIRKNGSALVPILRANVAVERVSLWNERGGGRPLRSVWLTNSSGLTLDAGSFTVLEDSTFAGEGLLESIKPGEKRLLSYAVDLGVQVESRLGGEQQRVSRVRMARGVAAQHSEHVSRKVYTIRNSDTSERTVVIEHPIRAGWTLVSGLVPAETSMTAYRFAVPVDAKGVATLAVEERRPIDTSYAISDLTDDQVALFVRETRDQARLTQALGPIQAKKAEIATLSAGIQERRAESETIAEDQRRLRENMVALKGSEAERQLVKRYVGQLDREEDRIAVLRRETADLEQRLQRAHAELAGLIEAVALDLEMLDVAPAAPGAADREEARQVLDAPAQSDRHWAP